MRQRRTVFASSDSTPSITEGVSRGDSLNDFIASIRCFFIAAFTVASPLSVVLVILVG